MNLLAATFFALLINTVSTHTDNAQCQANNSDSISAIVRQPNQENIIISW